MGNVFLTCQHMFFISPLPRGAFLWVIFLGTCREWMFLRRLLLDGIFRCGNVKVYQFLCGFFMPDERVLIAQGMQDNRFFLFNFLSF